MPDADRVEVIFPASAFDRIRTCNLLLTKQLLCHLSYRSIFGRSDYLPSAYALYHKCGNPSTL